MMSSALPPSQLAHPGWRFTGTKRVGRGATAEVWRARDAESGRDVALKVGREDCAAILAAEAERLVWVVSPELPELLDVKLIPPDAKHGLAEGAPYLAVTGAARRPVG